jgi:N6-adenosine-specific RNA methylase IME4
MDAPRDPERRDSAGEPSGYTAAEELRRLKGGTFGTILADPPWQFQNRTGKMAPEHRRLSRYSTLRLEEIAALPVEHLAADRAHLYLWVPNALLLDGLRVMSAWGFEYKTNIVWHKIRKDGGPDGRGVGFYFRNVTELVLFGVRGKNARTLAAGRRQVNFVATKKREHSRKPDELYSIIEACSPGPFLELFARGTRPNWTVWGNQATEEYVPSWPTYGNHSQAGRTSGTELDLWPVPEPS